MYMTVLTLPKSLINKTRNRHLIVWLLITIYYFIFSYTVSSLWVKCIGVAVLVLNDAWTYYLLLLCIFPKILGEKKLVYLFHVTGIFLLFLTIYTVQLQLLMPDSGDTPDRPFFRLVNNALAVFLYPLCAAIATYLNWEGIKRMEDDAILDKEMTEKEFQFLKNRFYSHSIFNFLNFCYKKIRQISPPAADSVEEFSEMLSYSLINPSDQPVSLEKEVAYIENYVAFHRTLTNDLYVSITCEGDMKNVFILPRILIVFIENSIKHGIVHDPLHPVTIVIKVTGNELFFSISNKNNNQVRMEESGIGLRNVEQILNLFYPGRHVLTISNTDDVFFCQLRLKGTQEFENEY